MPSWRIRPEETRTDQGMLEREGVCWRGPQPPGKLASLHCPGMDQRVAQSGCFGVVGTCGGSRGGSSMLN